VVCKSAQAAAKRFGVEDGKTGVVYTRTGRAYFNDDQTEALVIARVAAAFEAAGLWQELATDWALLDAELMPWSDKAQTMIDSQYFATASAASLSAQALIQATSNVVSVPELRALHDTAQQQLANADAMQRAIQSYCWPVQSIEDYKIAPFHLLAVEDKVFADQTHVWHMELLERLTAKDGMLSITGWKSLRLDNEEDCANLTSWWLEHTGKGGEGLVLKPLAFTLQGEKGLIQPAMKVRGKEYLRIIYGPDYDMPDNIERLRERGLGRKFSLAEREFLVGMEGLHRFVEGRPLAEVHACVLGVLALESEPVDPRL